MGWYYDDWKPYVSVAERRRQAAKKMDALRKKGVSIEPVEIVGSKIAKTFWGQAWCKHLESFSDYSNRLPRGRTYVRNGSVCHLGMDKGAVEAKVSGSELYTVRITIKTLPAKRWNDVKGRCMGQIGSLIELLQGSLSHEVMTSVTDRENGLFPRHGEMSFTCSCPDSARMCKHVAAVLYGVGARLDHKPELLFKLRGVDHEELISADSMAAVSAATAGGKSKRLASDALGDVFGIDIQTADVEPAPTAELPPPDAAKAGKKTTKKTAKKNVVKKTVKKATVKKTAKRKKKKATKKRPAKDAVAKTRQSDEVQ